MARWARRRRSFSTPARASIPPARKGPTPTASSSVRATGLPTPPIWGSTRCCAIGWTRPRRSSRPTGQPFVKTPPGAGPRHLTFHPNGKHVYVINELANSITLFDYEPESGLLIERQTISTLPKEFDGKSYCADLKITPDGRFLYGTNRGHDSLAAYRLGPDGRLTLLGIVPSLGKGPQNLAITPGGELLLCANMPGNNVAVFRIDPAIRRLDRRGPAGLDARARRV